MFSPGPGTYDSSSSHMKTKASVKSMKFGTGNRSSMENIHTQNYPGPSLLPDIKSIKQSAPIFGFGSSKRIGMGANTKTPGPGNYVVPNLVGREGR